MYHKVILMKKIYVMLISLVLLSSIVFAAQQGIHEPGTGIDNPDMKATGQGTGQGLDQGNGSDATQSGQGQQTNVETQNQGEVQQLQNKEHIQTQLNELKQTMQQKQQQLNAEADGSGEKQQQMMQNQNQVRVAAQTLSQMESMIGGRGKKISEIAKEFDNSVQVTIKAEEKIQTRSGFARFFAGGDKKVAEEIEGEVAQHKQRIQEPK